MAQDFKVVNAPIGCQPIGEYSTTQNHALGKRITAKDVNDGEAEFIYLKGTSGTVVGTWVTYDQDNFGTTRLAANAIGPVAIAMSACDASTKFGWYAIFGKIEAQMAANFADDGLVFATATAGVADDAVVAGDRVKNAYGAETITGAGLAEVRITYPYMDDGTAA